MFISVEGIDGSGKTTVVEYLKRKWFPDAIVTRQPIPEIRELFMSSGIGGETEALLAAASLEYECDVTIRPALRAGTDVISDRYSDSMLAYQGCGRGVDMDWLEALMPSITPDFTILLDCSVTAAFDRIARRGKKLDRIEAEELGFHQRVRQGFRDIADMNRSRIFMMSSNVSITDMLRRIDEEMARRVLR